MAALRIEIPTTQVIAGFACARAKPQAEVPVSMKGLVTSDDGDLIHANLEGLFSGAVGDAIRARGRNPELVQSILYYRGEPDRVVLWLDCPIVVKALFKGARELPMGSPAFTDEFADICKVTIDGIDLPRHGQYAYTFSHRWRRALIYDFGESLDTYRSHELKIAEDLATAFKYMWFRTRFRMDIAVLTPMFEDGWYPFARLPEDLATELYQDYEQGVSTDHTVKTILTHLGQQTFRNIAPGWYRRAALAPHQEFINRAIDRYAEQDYISSVCILSPRLEGVLRYLYAERQQERRPGQNSLLSHLTSAMLTKRGAFSIFFPQRFEDYLRRAFFSDFDLNQNLLPFSRHTVAHGVIQSTDCNQVRAIQLLLTLDQIALALAD
jgi:hypothetical protein